MRKTPFQHGHAALQGEAFVTNIDSPCQRGNLYEALQYRRNLVIFILVNSSFVLRYNSSLLT